MSNNKFPIGKTIRLQYTICGLLWIIDAICDAIDYKPLSLISGFIMVITYSFTLYIVTRKNDTDEMAESHLYYSGYRGSMMVMILIPLLMILVNLLTIKEWDFFNNISSYDLLNRAVVPIIGIIMGINMITIGLTFKSLEEE